MSTKDRLDVVRDAYRAYETGDRSLIEDSLSDDFLFYSPADPGIDRDEYFVRCWPNAQNLAHFELVRLAELGDEVLVSYDAEREDGSKFRNTEIFSFSGALIRRVEVYFGWDLK
jgi:ketosteroid isomerase-like protein